MRKSKIWAAVAIVTAFITIAFVCLYRINGGMQRLTRSSHTFPPTEKIIALNEKTEYPLNTQTIAIQVKNIGDYRGEIDKPVLEIKQDDVWYLIEKKPGLVEPANLLFVSPNEIREWEVYLSEYPNLATGRYRAVFDFWGVTDEYFAFEFDLVAP